jgi:hypothetical protein
MQHGFFVESDMVTHRHQNRSDCQREILNPIGGLFLASIPGLLLASAEGLRSISGISGRFFGMGR